MAVASNSSKKKTSASKGSSKASSPAIKLSPRAVLLLSVAGGAILGLSAPGFDQFYLSWFALSPLFLLIESANGKWQACQRGFVFALAYNLIYLNWYLQLHPLSWLGFNDFESVLLAAAAWLVVSTHQALITAITVVVLKLIPTTGGFLPRVVEKKWKLPALIVIPLIWVAFNSKLLNAPDFLGVPWTMLEYSQYKQLPVLQITGIIGGIGLGALLVLFNAVIAEVVATTSGKSSLKPLASGSRQAAFTNALIVALIGISSLTWGFYQLAANKPTADVPLSVVQGNINIEMQKTKHAYTLSELTSHYRRLLAAAPAGLCIWTESALPAYLKNEPALKETLASFSRDGKRDMIIGSLDRDFDGHPFNSAFGIAADGSLSDVVYHKRYLVPFGEYLPAACKLLPESIQRLTNTPAGGGFSSGKFPVVLRLSGKGVAPLICFETLSPELVSSSVRNGGNLLVNLSDLAWFHESMIGDQMVAFSVLRAVETGRYFVFAANTGPSAIIAPSGQIVALSPRGKETVLTGKVALRKDLTPFTVWFH
jgi:apolipoprotein N-acyltransferase